MVSNIGKYSPLTGEYETNPTKTTGDVTISNTPYLGATTEESLQTLDIDQNPTIEQYENEIEEILKQIKLIEEKIEQLRQEQDRMAEQDVAPGSAENFAIEQRFSEISREKTRLYDNILSLLSDVSSIRQKINDNLLSQALSASISGVSDNYNWTNFSPDMGDISLGGSDLGNATAQLGLSFVGKVNTDSQGNALFSNGRQEAWCADFVTWVTKQAYAKAGKQVPAGFGSPSVSNIQEWGKKNGRYVSTENMSSQQRANYIAQNIKPGDIIIQKRNGVSHTGIVVKVYPDGSFDTVEGNTSDSVKRRSYKADDKKLSGFVKMA